MPYKDPERQRRYQREFLTGRRAEWLAGKACVVCGTTEDLEVHHRDRGEKASHRVWSWSAKRREAELAKCEVRCRRCHFEDHGYHGSAQRYASGCSCAFCVAFAGAALGQMGLL